MSATKQLFDSGSLHGDHYRRCLPPWRLKTRELFLPIIRYETPIIADFQRKFQTPGRDSYFALTANLGTHTFFMVMLPIIWWSGFSAVARAFVQMLAAGVFFSGFLKDAVCLPRPLSPPVQRISRSSSAVLEYGFPSTHSTNAISVAVYLLNLLHQSEGAGWKSLVLQGLVYVYVASIVVGRVYCGMHGFVDVIVGALLGALIALIQIEFGARFDVWILEGSIRNVLIVILVILVLVRVHPEPADDCPCFDDSIAFSGVVLGIQAGGWSFCRSGFADVNVARPDTVPFSLEQLGLVKTLLRIAVGVLFVFIWRGTMKPMLLKTLPPLFRLIEHFGLSLPRRYFLKASEYRSVPPLRKDDAVIPSAREIPGMLGSLKNPRKRTISIGPQSEADAYEAIAHRNRVRRESMTKSGPSTLDTTTLSSNGPLLDSKDAHAQPLPTFTVTTPSHLSQGVTQSPLDKDDDDAVLVHPAHATTNTNDFQTPAEMKAADEIEDRAMFAKLQAPRIRYDVEVVTKLIIYTGIGLIASEMGPILFELCGLGMGIRPA